MALGYQGDDIRSELKGYDVEFFTNPFYDITNSIVSIWFAKQFMTGIEDILIMNADVYLEKNTLESIMKSKLERVVFADSDRTIDADYKLKYTDILFSIMANIWKVMIFQVNISVSGG